MQHLFEKFYRCSLAKDAQPLSNAKTNHLLTKFEGQ
jgi:hypothetical protein